MKGGANSKDWLSKAQLQDVGPVRVAPDLQIAATKQLSAA